MNKKKTGKSKAARSVRDLPAKTLKAQTAKGVKGGSFSVELRKSTGGGNVSGKWDLLANKSS